VSSLLSCLAGAVRLKAGSQGSALSRKAVWLAGLVVFGVLLLPAMASAAVCSDTYKGLAEGEWQIAANWSAEHVPTSSDVACIGSGSTVDVSSGTNQVGVVQGEGTLVIGGSTLEVTNALEPSVISGLVLNFGAVLAGAATVEASTSFAWNKESTMSGSGKTVVGSSASGSITMGFGTASLVGRTLVNEGTFNYVEGVLRMTEGAHLDNSGTFKANEDETAFDITTETGTAAPVIVNTGTFEKTKGTGDTKVEVNFENSGTITTTTGKLTFGEREIAVTLAGGSLLEGTEIFNKATITGGSFKAPAGKVTVEHGVLTIPEGSTASIADFTMNFESTVTGAGTLDLPGSFLWNLESTMSGTGSTVIQSGAMARLEMGNDTAKLAERTLVNEGTFTMVEGTLQMSKNARFKNEGTYNANAENLFGITAAEKDLTALFINKGVFQKAEGINSTKIEVDFENEGTVEAKTGKFVFGENKAIAVSFGSSTVLAGEVLFNDGTVSFGTFKAPSANVDIANVPATVSTGNTTTIGKFTMDFESVLTGGGTLKISNTFLWNKASSMTGTGATVIESGATGTIPVGEDSVKITSRSLINEGTLTWAEGKFVMTEGAQLNNAGTFNANSENPSGIVTESEGLAPLIVNSGTFQKVKGTGETKVEVNFENLGVINNVTGKLVIKHPVTIEVSTQYGGNNPSGPGQEHPTCVHPVDCATGNFFEAQTDLAVGGRGVGLDLTRTYNAQAASAGATGAFGAGWSNSFSDHLTVSQGKAVLYQANGSTVPFTEGKGESFTPPSWSQDSMSGSTVNGYSVVLANQIKYQFEGSTGKLRSVTDRNGNQTKLAYNKGGQIETITDPDGRKITLTYNGEGLIESAKDPMGHTVKYTYESGNLKSVTEPGEAKPRWQYGYDGSHQMTSSTDGREGKTTTEYDSSHRVTLQKDPLERNVTFEYEPFHTKIINHTTGSVTDERFTSNDLPFSITRGFGTASATTATFTYDAENNLASITDGNGHKTKYTYDGEANRTSMVDPNEHETKWIYNGTHDVLTVTTPNGEKTTITRDSHGNAETVSRPAPGKSTQTTTYSYDVNGNVKSVVDPLKHTWSYEYNNQGDRTGETDPEGDKRTIGYNEDSRETSTVSPAGNVKGAETSQFTTKIERDAQNRPITITDPLGHTIKYTYDANGNLETITDSNGHTTTFTYDADNEATKTKEASGTTTETGYDGSGRVTSQTDGNKHTTTYTRNAVGEITEIKDPLGRITKKEYDAVGNLTAVTDPAKRTAKYSYDPANRLKEISYSDGKTPAVKYEYDADGNRTKMTDGTGKSTYTYNVLDRLVQNTDGHGDSTGYEYDLAGNQTKLTYPNGTLVTRAYDNAGRLQSVTDPSKNTTTFAYDPNSNLATTTFPKGTSEQDKLTYNRADQQTKLTMTGSGLKVLASIAYGRDNNGQVKTTTTTGLPGSASASYVYDTNNRLTSGAGTSYEYDAANNPTKIGANTYTYDAGSQLEAGGGTTYNYDQVGERTTSTPKGSPATTFAYDQAGNLNQVKQAKTTLNDTYAYNGDGLRASQTKLATTNYLTWDTHRRVPLILSDEQNSYVYGPGSIPIEQIQSKGIILYLHHDQQGSTRMLTSSTGAIEATKTYDAYGNLTGTTGTTTTPIGYDGQYTTTDNGLIYLRARTYDPTTAQFLTADPLKATTWAPYTYTYDNPINEADPTGLCNENPVSVSFWAEGNCLSGAVGGPNGGGSQPTLWDIPAYAAVTVPCLFGGEAVCGGALTASAVASFSGNCTTGAVYPNYNDPTQAPGPGWEWKGNGPVGSSEGSWYNPTTDQSVYPDLDHALPKGPHYDYFGPNYPREPKSPLFPGDPIPEVP
jgi:RHS repeat-associated protein